LKGRSWLSWEIIAGGVVCRVRHDMRAGLSWFNDYEGIHRKLPSLPVRGQFEPVREHRLEHRDHLFSRWIAIRLRLNVISNVVDPIWGAKNQALVPVMGILYAICIRGRSGILVIKKRPG
jgi:hypothetical protein